MENERKWTEVELLKYAPFPCALAKVGKTADETYIVYVNPALTEFSKGALRPGKPIKLASVPQYEESFFALIEQAVRGYSVERRIYSPGTGCWVLFFAYKISDEGDVVLAVKDIQDDYVARKADADKRKTADSIIEMMEIFSTNDPIEKKFDELLKALHASFYSDRCFVLIYARDGNPTQVYEYHRPNRTSRKKDLESMNFRISEKWMKNVTSKDKDLFFNKNIDPKFLEEYPQIAASIKEFGLHNSMLVPLYEKGESIGWLGADNIGEGSFRAAKSSLLTLAPTVASSYVNDMLVKRLTYLSESDSLTGAKNRNSMELAIDGYNEHPGKSLGIVFSDVNGLKHTNDIKGHRAGDVLLQNATKLLSQYFPIGRIYRAGGDEFVILDPDSTREEFEKKVNGIRDSQSKFEVSVSLASEFLEPVASLREEIDKTDAKMYEAKRAFYLLHPEYER